MSDAFVNPRTITPQELYVLGVQHLAYVKQVSEDGMEGYAAFAADGTKLGVMASRELAFAALRQHDLEPVSVH